MMKSLKDFNLKERIFIDANIFSFHHLDHPEFGNTCTEFLQKVENSEVNAITSTQVIDEVAFVILIVKGCEILKTDKTRKVREKIKSDRKFSKECYEAVKLFLSYVDFLKKTGLEVIEINLEDINSSTDYGSNYGLLPHDAIHVAIMEEHGIRHIATADSDFEKVEKVMVWCP